MKELASGLAIKMPAFILKYLGWIHGFSFLFQLPANANSGTQWEWPK